MESEDKQAWALLLRMADGWKDITTAPKDGTRIEFLSADSGLKDRGYWCDYRGQSMTGIEGEWDTELGNGDMTHWRPIQREP